MYWERTIEQDCDNRKHCDNTDNTKLNIRSNSSSRTSTIDRRGPGGGVKCRLEVYTEGGVWVEGDIHLGSEYFTRQVVYQTLEDKSWHLGEYRWLACTGTKKRDLMIGNREDNRNDNRKSYLLIKICIRKNMLLESETWSSETPIGVLHEP